MNAPYVSHSRTSYGAAQAIGGAALNALQRRVFNFLSDRGPEGATDEELQLALQMNPSTQRPRRIELVRWGMVGDSGRTRTTASGRAAVVWVVL
jgi:hypothetical protein